MRLTSPDLEPGGLLAADHTPSGENRPPRLLVDDIPAGTAELALIVHDPDPPLPHGFTHWLRFGLPARNGEITAGDLAHRDGVNDFGNLGYDGPTPPSGHGLHHYYFWVYALSERIDGAPSRLHFLERYAERILAQERLVGTYSR